MSLKYRPSLTIGEIQFVLSSINWSDNPEHSQLLRKLEVFTLKATHGITQASHVVVGKQSIESKLGFEADTTAEKLLEHWKINPSRLSKTQLAVVNQHRYLNDMMTPEEEANYESQLEY